MTENKEHQAVTRNIANGGQFGNQIYLARIKFCNGGQRCRAQTATCHIAIRYPQAENQPHILALSVFAETQIQRKKNQKS